MTKNMYGVNNRSNGVVRMYVTTSVTHKPEMRTDLLTFMQIVDNLALDRIQSYARFITYSCIAISANFSYVS